MEQVQFIILAFTMCATIVAVLSGLMWARQWAELYAFRRRFEDVYIVGKTPDGTEPDFGALNDLVDFVDATDVYATQQHYNELLVASQNQLGVSIYTWRYQYGAHINETLEEYTERVLLDIKSSRAARHEYEAKEDPAWYQKYQHGENYIPYEW